MEKRLFNKIEYNYNLQDFLVNMTKDELNEIRKTLKIKGISKLKKDQLIVELGNYIFDNLSNIITEQLQEEILWIKDILDKDGILDYKDELIDKLIKCRNVGVVFSGIIEEARKVLIIPDDLRFPIKEIIMTNKEHEECKHNSEWINITRKILNYYGVLSVEDAYKMFMKVCGEKIDFHDYIVQAVSVDNEFYNYNQEDKIIHLKDVEKPLYMLHQQGIKSFPYFQVNNQMINKEDILVNEKAMYEMLTKDYEVQEEKAHENVKMFMNKVKNGYSLKDSAEEMFSSMNFIDIEKANEFMERVIYFYNNTRIWGLKGYTYSEFRYVEKSNGKTIIKTNKIGRNDPCPCGSGKKYKKCCGK